MTIGNGTVITQESFVKDEEQKEVLVKEEDNSFVSIKESFEKFEKQKNVLEELIQHSKRMCMIDVVLELERRIPKEWEKYVKSIFSFKTLGTELGKTNMADYIFASWYSDKKAVSVGGVVIPSKHGFLSKEDCFEKTPSIIKAWAGIIDVHVPTKREWVDAGYNLEIDFSFEKEGVPQKAKSNFQTRKGKTTF